MTLSSSALQSDSGLDSIRNYCDVLILLKALQNFLNIKGVIDLTFFGLIIFDLVVLVLMCSFKRRECWGRVKIWASRVPVHLWFSHHFCKTETRISHSLNYAIAFILIFIGPEFDHCLPLSLTHSLTDWLTHSLLFSKLDWCDPDVWRCQLQTCWGCYCWWWGSCWRQFVADLEAEV